MRAALLLFVLALIPSQAALAAPVPVPATASPELADHPKTVPLTSLSMVQKQAMQNALGQLDALRDAKAGGHHAIAFLKILQARRAAGVNVLTGVK